MCVISGLKGPQKAAETEKNRTFMNYGPPSFEAIIWGKMTEKAKFQVKKSAFLWDHIV